MYRYIFMCVQFSGEEEATNRCILTLNHHKQTNGSFNLFHLNFHQTVSPHYRHSFFFFFLVSNLFVCLFVKKKISGEKRFKVYIKLCSFCKFSFFFFCRIYKSKWKIEEKLNQRKLQHIISEKRIFFFDAFTAFLSFLSFIFFFIYSLFGLVIFGRLQYIHCFFLPLFFFLFSHYYLYILLVIFQCLEPRSKRKRNKKTEEDVFFVESQEKKN